MTRKSVTHRLDRMKADMRQLVAVLNADESYDAARAAQAALETIDNVIEQFPIDAAEVAWPPRLRDGGFVLVDQ